MFGLPKFTPLPLTRQAAAFDHPDWYFEIKYDGFRALAYVAEGQCQLVSRNDHAYSRFRDLMRAIPKDVDAANAVLDGEVVVLDDQGRPQFYDLMGNRGTPCFAAFDLLWLDGEDYRDIPLWERKELLRGVLVPPAKRILFVEHLETNGIALFKSLCDQDMEGIVAKPKLSPYHLINGETTWIKVKNTAYSQAAGRGEFFKKKRR